MFDKMKEFLEIQELIQDFNNEMSILEVNSNIKIKKHFLNFQLNKLVQTQSELNEYFRELETLEEEFKNLIQEFQREGENISGRIKKQNKSFLRDLEIESTDFLENVKEKAADDSKADEMAKVIIPYSTKHRPCSPCFNSFLVSRKYLSF